MPNEWQRWKGIMKCYPFEEKRLNKWTPPYIVQPKYDGVRCRAIQLDSGEYLLLSSEENVLSSVPHLNEILKKLDLGRNIELDGELYVHGLSFEEIVSITSRTVNLHPDYKRIQFHCFDVVNNEDQMRRLLMIEELRSKSPWLAVAPYWLCYTLDDVTKVFDKVVDLGYEGIIVRHPFNFYERKRSTMVMKFKPKKEDIYEIIGYNEEIDQEGLGKGSLGALICRSGDGSNFGVGTGFSAEQRQILWEIKETLIGKVAKVKYQHITANKKVPRFPVFVEVA